MQRAFTSLCGFLHYGMRCYGMIRCDRLTGACCALAETFTMALNAFQPAETPQVLQALINAQRPKRPQTHLKTLDLQPGNCRRKNLQKGNCSSKSYQELLF